MLDQTLASLANEIPGATAVFNKYQLSFCCGGQHTLKEAIAKFKLDESDLLTELHALANPEQLTCQPETLSDADLIDHILTRYHKVHRAQLTELRRLAARVESVHGSHPACPQGLSAHLDDMAQDLEQHMLKEENILFPMLSKGMGNMASGPISVMLHEHAEHQAALRKIVSLTQELSLPEGACNTWRALYFGLEEFMQDLATHMHLENEILFKRQLN